MKLLYCVKCDSIVRLILNKHRQCECGNTGGRYIDDLNAIYYGTEAFPMGIDNKSFSVRLRKNIDENMYFNIARKLDIDSADITCFTFGKGSWCSNGTCGKSLSKLTKKAYLKIDLQKT